MCPITWESLEEDAVMLCDGSVYSEKAIMNWLRAHDRSPLTNVEVEHKRVLQLVPVQAIMQEVLAETTNLDAEFDGLVAEASASQLREWQGKLEVQLAERRGSAQAVVTAVVRTFVARCVVEMLVSMAREQEREVNAIERDGEANLILAAEQGSVALCVSLLEQDIDPNSCNGAEQTPAMIAAMHGRQDVLHLLCWYRADLNMSCTVSNTALHCAARAGHLEVVEFLVEQCHQLVDRQGEMDLTAVQLAAEKGHLKIVRLLCKEGANINLEDCEGKLATVHAARHGHRDVVRHLVDMVGRAPGEHRARTPDVGVRADYREEGWNAGVASERGTSTVMDASMRIETLT